MYSSFTVKSATTSSSDSTAVDCTSVAPPIKKKRIQVSKACTWCRVHRIKCDSSKPCTNCRERGGKCSNDGLTSTRSLPQAVREIEKLQAKVKVLEERLKEQERAPNQSPLTPNLTHETKVGDTRPQRSNSFSYYAHASSSWGGIHAKTAHSQQTQWYGPSSAFYFIGRMSKYLSSTTRAPLSDEHIQPNSASKSFASPIYARKVILEDNTWTTDASAREEYLNGVQEEFFLDMYWQSYHCTYQILDEVKFKEHYESLWTGHARRPSALVDIVLALCMQYGIAFLPRKSDGLEKKCNVDTTDATIAGRWYYHRCQTLLTAELESPTISTLQCHILSVVYLCNASFQNMAHTMLATAIRIAQILGLHLEPPQSMAQDDCELRKRIWWTLYTIELKTCMKLGRPTSVRLHDFTASLPSDDPKVAANSGTTFITVSNDVTWLTYGLQLTKLVLCCHNTYASFYTYCSELIATKATNTIYDDPETLEDAAIFLSTNIQPLHEWRDKLPLSLQTPRKDNGLPYSTSLLPLALDVSLPLWFQRQRIFLELLYHNLLMNLHRPFIHFPSPSPSPLQPTSPPSPSSTPNTDKNAITSLHHAQTITSITHQLLASTSTSASTEITQGWHEAYQWQWNAVLTTIGFIIAYPSHESTSTARKSVGDAIVVLEILGEYFAIAASAAVVARGLVGKADVLVERARKDGGMGLEQLDIGADVEAGDGDGDGVMMGEAEGVFNVAGNDEFAGFMDFAFENSSEWLMGGTSDVLNTWSALM